MCNLRGIFVIFETMGLYVLLFTFNGSFIPNDSGTSFFVLNIVCRPVKMSSCLRHNLTCASSNNDPQGGCYIGFHVIRIFAMWQWDSSFTHFTLECWEIGTALFLKFVTNHAWYSGHTSKKFVLKIFIFLMNERREENSKKF